MSEIKGEISGLNDRMENLIVIIFFVPNGNRRKQKAFFTPGGEGRLFNISSISCATNLLALSRRSGCIFLPPFLPPSILLPPSAPCLNSRVALH